MPDRGVAEDDEAFAEIVEDPAGDGRRGLDSPWLYRSAGVVFGPVPAKELLELLYSGEIDAETPVAPEDGDFQALRRFGAFRAHIERAARAVAERRAAEARARAEARAQRARRLRWAAFAAAAVVIGSSIVYGVVRHRRSVEARARVERELAALLEGISIEPPLMPLVDGELEPEPVAALKTRGRAASGAGERSRSASSGESSSGEGEPAAPERPSDRRSGQRRAKVSSGSSAHALTDREVVSGVGRAFDGLAACIRSQLRRSPSSVPDTVVLTFGINNRGRAQDVSITDRFLRKSPLRACFEARLTAVRWRAYEGQVRDVEYPITIRRPR